jgi:hypothetical protein
MPESERRQRTVLWWLVFVQDRWWAASVGRPVLIKEEDCDVSRPDERIGSLNDANDGELGTGTFFKSLISLTFILDEILHNFM